MESTVTARPAGAAPARTRAVLAGGALAGILGVVATVAFMVLAALVDDRPIEMALRPLAAYAGGEGLALVLVAAVEVTVFAAALGAVLAWLLPADLPLGGSAVSGTAYGLAVLAVLASVAAEVQSTMAPLGGSWVIAFGILGAVLGAAPALWRRQRRLARRVPAAPHEPAGHEAPA